MALEAVKERRGGGGGGGGLLLICGWLVCMLY